MIKVTSRGGNAHLLHIKAAASHHHAPLCAVLHHGGRQHSGKMVSIIIIGSTGRFVLLWSRLPLFTQNDNSKIVEIIMTMIMMIMNNDDDNRYRHHHYFFLLDMISQFL